MILQSAGHLRHLRTLSAAICFGLFFVFVAAVCGATETTALSCALLPELVGGEIISYEMDFWLFKGAASGSLRFEPHEQGYRAVFEAETKGLITVVAGKRREVMESIMAFDAAQRRFKPLRFQETFSHGGHEFIKILTFNYDRNMYACIYRRNGKTVLDAKKKLPREPFDDLLTMLCNLRAGVYGSVAPNRTLRICVLAKDRPSFVIVASPPPPVRGAPPEGRLYALVSMDSDMTQARSKTLRGWFSEEMVPVGGVIEDAYFFGDLTVRLINRTIAAPQRHKP